jgi:hypothetical protein
MNESQKENKRKNGHKAAGRWIVKVKLRRKSYEWNSNNKFNLIACY